MLSKNSRKIRIASLLLSVCLFFSCVACEKNAPAVWNVNTTERYIADIDLNLSLKEMSAALGWEKGALDSGWVAFFDMAEWDGSVYLLYEYLMQSEVARISRDDGLEAHFAIEISEDEEPLRIHVSEEGNIYVWVKDTSKGLWEPQYKCMVYMAGTASPVIMQVPALDGESVLDIEFNGTDRFCVATLSHIKLFDLSLALAEDVRVSKDNQNIVDVAFSSDKEIVLLVTDEEQQLFMIAAEISHYKQKSMVEIQGLTQTDAMSSKLVVERIGDLQRIYLDTDSAIYACDDATGALFVYFNKAMREVYSLTTSWMTADGEWMMFGFVDSDAVVDREVFIARHVGLFSLRFQKDDRPVQTLRVGIANASVDTVQTYLNLFTKQHSEYVFEIIDYNMSDSGTNGEQESPSDRLYADMLSGNAPDILFVDALTYNRFEAPNVFIDMSESLFDTDVAVPIRKDEYLPNVLSAMYSGQALYHICPFFSLKGMYTLESTEAIFRDASIEDMAAFLDSVNPRPRLFLFNQPEEVFSTILTNLLQNGLCRNGSEYQADMEKIKSLLLFSTTYGTDVSTDFTVPLMEQISDGKVLYTEKRIYSFINYLDDLEREVGRNCTFVSAPGVPQAAPILDTDMIICIPVAGKQSEAALALTRFCMSAEVQSRYADVRLSMGFMPILSSAFDVMLEDQYASYLIGGTPSAGEISLVFGNTAIDIDNQENLGSGVPSAPVSPISKDDAIGNFKAFVTSAVCFNNPNDDVERIIMEEASSYFSGDKSIEQVMTNIESRVQVLVGEKS